MLTFSQGKLRQAEQCKDFRVELVIIDGTTAFEFRDVVRETATFVISNGIADIAKSTAKRAAPS